MRQYSSDRSSSRCSASFFKRLCVASVALALPLFASSARADGLAAAAADLAPAERAKLSADIAAYRQKNPEAFDAVANLKGYRPEAYAKFQKKAPQVTTELRRLGKTMLLPMIDALVFHAPDLHGANDVERRAVIEGMLEEVGRIRDARGAGPLAAVFAKSHPAPVLRAAALAMGRMCEAGASFDKLKAGLGDAARHAAAIDGLGQCRTLAGAKLLAAALDRLSASSADASSEATTADEATAIAKALGELGSSWAWDALAQTGGEPKRVEGLAAREVAAAAVVRGFVRFGGEARGEHKRSLTRIAHPETRRIAGTHGGGDAATRSELEAVVVAIETK